MSFQMDLRGDWSSACPALLRNSRRNQVTPDFCAAEELSHRCGLLWRAFAGAVPAPKGRGLLVFGRVEALDALFERRKLDDDEAVEFLGTFFDPMAPAAREHLGAVL